MAGSNLVIPKGKLLFEQGEPSDGMYVIRQGEVAVFIEKGGTDVRLATVTAGSMLGEMALFDQKPRSASAKAIQDTEVTKISNDDFKKIMKQIPKWFVGLMTTLSTRLRETNDKLHALQSHVTGVGRPFENTLRSLHILGLLWHKIGVKEQKHWVIERKEVESETIQILGLHASIAKGIIDALGEGGLIKIVKNSYGAEQLTIVNRGNLQKFIEFLDRFAGDFPDRRDFPPCLAQILQLAQSLVSGSAYDTVTVPFDDIELEAGREGVNVRNWRKSLVFLDRKNDTFALVKVSADEVGLKINKNAFPRDVANYRILVALVQAGVT